MSAEQGTVQYSADFATAAKDLLKDSQLRRNVRHATDVITPRKRGIVTEELKDWQELRESGSAIREHVLHNLAGYLEQFEKACTAAGGQVHWAADAAEANAIVLELVRAHEVAEVLKIKSMTTEEIGAESHAGAAWDPAL